MKNTPPVQNKGLQELTELQMLIKTLLVKGKISPFEIKGLSPEQLIKVQNALIKKINRLKGDQREEFIENVDEVITQDLKNQIWEDNHFHIVTAMKTLMLDHECMPSKNDIAKETGLSRQTIYKHLKDYATHPVFADNLQQFSFMADTVLATVIKSANAGNMKAAKLYFDLIGQGKHQWSGSTTIENQTNNIQINGTIINQKSIENLTPEQLDQIEGILRINP